MSNLITDYQDDNDPRQREDSVPVFNPQEAEPIPDSQLLSEEEINNLEPTVDVSAPTTEPEAIQAEAEALTEATQENPPSEQLPDYLQDAVQSIQPEQYDKLIPLESEEVTLPELDPDNLLQNQLYGAIDEAQSNGSLAPALYDVLPGQQSVSNVDKLYRDIIIPGLDRGLQNVKIREVMLNNAGTALDRLGSLYNPITSSGEGDLTRMELLGRVATEAPTMFKYVHQDGTVFDPTPGLRKFVQDLKLNPAATLMNTITNPFGAFGSLTRGSKWGNFGNNGLGMAGYLLSLPDNLVFADTTEDIAAIAEQESRNTDGNYFQQLLGIGSSHIKAMERKLYRALEDPDGSYKQQALLGRDFSPTSNRRRDGANLLSFGTGGLVNPGDTIRTRAENSGFWNIINTFTPESFKDRKMKDIRVLPNLSLEEFTEFWAGFGTEVTLSPSTYYTLGILPTLKQAFKRGKNVDGAVKQADETAKLFTRGTGFDDVQQVQTVQKASDVTSVPQEITAKSKGLNLQIPNFTKEGDIVRSPLSDYVPAQRNLIDPSAIGYTPRNKFLEQVPEEVNNTIIKNRETIFKEAFEAMAEVKEANARLLEEAKTLKKHLDYTNTVENLGRKPILEDVPKFSPEESTILQEAKKIEWADSVSTNKKFTGQPIFYDGRPITVKNHPLARGKTVMMSGDELTKADNFNDLIVKREEGVRDFLESSEEIYAPEVVRKKDGTLTFIDGRHRTKVLLEEAEEIPVNLIDEVIPDKVPTGETWADIDKAAIETADKLNKEWYHGTRNGASDLDFSPESINYGSRSPSGVGLHLTNNSDLAQAHAKSIVNMNIPDSGIEFSDDLGRVHILGNDFDKVLSGENKLLPEIEDVLKGVINETTENVELANTITNAIEKADNVTDMFNRIDESLYKFGNNVLNESEALLVQRKISVALREMGYDAILFKGKDGLEELTVINPEKLIKSRESLPIPTGNFVEQLAHKANTETIANEKLFPDSKQAQRAVADAQSTLANQRVYESHNFLKDSNEVALDKMYEYTDEYLKRSQEEIGRIKELQTLNEKLVRESSEKLAQRSSRDVQLSNPTKKFMTPDRNTIKTTKGEIHLTEDEKTRLSNLDEFFEMSGKTNNSAREMDARSIEKTEAMLDFAMDIRMSRMLDLTNNNIGALEHQAAVMFNAKNKLFGLTLERSKAGILRDNIIELKNAGEAVIEEGGRILSLQTVKDIKDLLFKGLKGKLTNKEINDLAIDVIEIGATPKLKAKYGTMPQGEVFLKERFDTYMNKLSGLGLTPKQISELNDKAVVLSNTMDELRIRGNALGLDIGKTELIGYIRRYFNPNVKKYLSDLENTRRIGKDKITPDTIQETFDKSRKTYHYIPEDEEILAKMLGMELEELQDVVARGELKGILDGLDDELFEQITDSHVLSKIPWTTREVVASMAEKYKGKLPMKLQENLFLNDPSIIVDNYTQFLKENASQSNAFRRIVSDGIKNGWVVLESMFSKEGNKLNSKDFKQLSVDEIRKYNPSYVPQTKENLYMDKRVWDHLNSVYEFETSPFLQSAFMQVVRQFSRGMVQGFLMTPQYLFRNTYDATLSYIKGGGNPARIPVAVSQYKQITTKGLDALDNTTKRFSGASGSLITERELLMQFITLLGNPKAPGLPAYKNLGAGKLPNPQEIHNLLINPKQAVGTMMNHFKNDLEYLTKRGKDFNFGSVLAEIGKGTYKNVGNVKEEIFSKLANGSAFIETAHKWQLFKDLTDTTLKKGDAVTTLKAKQTIEDVFISWDETGTAVKSIGALIPFYSYVYQNIPKTIRHMQRRPDLYKNLFKLYNANQRGLAEDYPELNQYNTPGFFGENMPLYLYADQDGRPMTMFLNNFDSTADFFATSEKESKKFGRVQQRLVGTPQEQAKQEMSGDEGINAWFKNITGDSLPMLRFIAGAATGVNPDTGRPIAGGEDTGRLTDFNPMVEYLLSSIPEVYNLIRWNPAGLFGTPEIIDSKTGEILSAPKPGVLGGNMSPRIEFDTTKYTNPLGAIAILGYLGFNVKTIDTIKSVNMTRRDLDSVVKQLSRKISEKEKLFAEADFRPELKENMPKRYTKAEEDMKVLVAKYVHFATELYVVDSYMQKYGIRNQQELNKIKNDVYRQHWTEERANALKFGLELIEKKKLDRFLPNPQDIPRGE